MSVSLINALDERMNGQDSRLLSLEKLTKEIHMAVQKYKTKPFEKVVNDKIDTLSNEMVKFQEGMKLKFGDLQTILDQKCKKAVSAAFESRLAKIEFDVREVLNLPEKEGGKKQRTPTTTAAAKTAGNGYSARNEIAHLKKGFEEALKSVEKVKNEHFTLNRRV
jgi:ABC-type uncharacterized transport system ATPase subunit